MGDTHPELALRYSAEHAEMGHGLFLARALDRGLSELRSADWATGARAFDVAEVIYRHTHEGHETVLFEHAMTLVAATLYSGRVTATVAGPTAEAVETTLAELRRRLPVPDTSAAHEVTVTFWTYGPHGPQPAWRSIAVPGWDEIRGNYAAQTQAQLESLMRTFEPARGGQLILWHGKPGTGKTFALRALAWEWREWCEFHYIVDPDSFFGEHADYLMGVLLQPEYAEMPGTPFLGPGVTGVPGASAAGLLFDGDGADDAASRPKPWRVLLLEDTGELLSADARMLMGQGLSRFLNVVDGLIGQGLRVLALVTTNEEIRRLHPAVARPGRAAANVEFRPLTPEEAGVWLHAHHREERPDGNTVLAELFAFVEGAMPGALVRSVGFGGV